MWSEQRSDVEVTSTVSCFWASLAATRCWESSSFSTANCKQTHKCKPAEHAERNYSHRWVKVGSCVRPRAHTDLAFFCRSTIWERRCVISSCWRAASSVLRASSSAMAEIWRLDNPDGTGRLVQTEGGRDVCPKHRGHHGKKGHGKKKNNNIYMYSHRKTEWQAEIEMERLTEFIDTVVDQLLLLFLVRFRLRLQMVSLHAHIRIKQYITVSVSSSSIQYFSNYWSQCFLKSDGGFMCLWCSL